MNLLDRKILLKKEVKAILRVSSDSSFQEMINAGEFPKGFRVGLRRVGWFEDEVSDWLRQRIAERDRKPKPHKPTHPFLLPR